MVQPVISKDRRRAVVGGLIFDAPKGQTFPLPQDTYIEPMHWSHTNSLCMNAFIGGRGKFFCESLGRHLHDNIDGNLACRWGKNDERQQKIINATMGTIEGGTQTATGIPIPQVQGLGAIGQGIIALIKEAQAKFGEIPSCWAYPLGKNESIESLYNEGKEIQPAQQVQPIQATPERYTEPTLPETQPKPYPVPQKQSNFSKFKSFIKEANEIIKETVKDYFGY